MPKVFKMSIAQLFCVETKQYELPDIDGISVNLFSSRQWKYIRNVLTQKRYPDKTVSFFDRSKGQNITKSSKGDHVFNSESKIARFWFKILQCKDLANEVPNEMIKQTYEKHRKALSTVHKTPEGLLQQVRSYANQFAQVLKKNYRDRAPLALTTAPYESKRSEGGTRKFLEPLLTFNKSQRIKTITRIDPVVIHLVGAPGLGKSYVSEHLIRKLADHFGIRKEFARYSRSMACEHWDGYAGNLIAQIDDVFTSRDGEKDAKQIIQMCSNADWVVPMADLRDKGKKFTSEFLILSSNNRFAKGMYINNDEAIDRRIYNPCFEIVKFDKKTGIYKVYVKSIYQTVDDHLGEGLKKLQTSPVVIKEYNINLDDLVLLLFNYSIETYNQRLESLELIDQCVYRKTFMPIIPATNFNYKVGYNFDVCPKDLPKVKAHAIPEPLKVRMITKGEAQNYVLKPLQLAMHKSLKSFPCFRLTSGQDILDNFRKERSLPKKGKHRLFVSGDYSAATDNLHMDVMSVVISELLKVLPSHIHDYVIRESGAHLIEYPEWTNLEPVVQTNGQLMGSLLSFPILCIANAATYGSAIKCEKLSELPALINGDDISFEDCMRTINIWKRKALQMGLEPSLGKNFLSDKWFTINSQFVEVDNKRKITVKKTISKIIRDDGDFFEQTKQDFVSNKKVSDSSRITKINPSEGFNLLWSRKARHGEINTIRDALKRFKKNTVVHFLKSQLKRTPRSIDIAVKFGGLGLENSKKPSKTDREINLMCYLKTQTKVISNLDGYWKLVQLSTELARTVRQLDLLKSAVSQGQYPPKRPSFEVLENEPTYMPLTEVKEIGLSEEFKQFREFKKFYKTVPELRNWINSEHDLIPIKDGRMISLWLTVPEYELLPKHNLIKFD